MLIIKDLNEKKEMLDWLNYYYKYTKILLESIYDELKSNNPQIEPLLVFPSEVDFKEISLSQDILKKYIGTYKSGPNEVLLAALGADRKNQLAPVMSYTFPKPYS